MSTTEVLDLLIQINLACKFLNRKGAQELADKFNDNFMDTHIVVIVGSVEKLNLGYRICGRM